MIPELMARRIMRKRLAAFAAKDVDGWLRGWADDAVMEFPPGLPMAGRWEGLPEIRGFFVAAFEHVASYRMTLHRVAVLHPWSPRGRSTWMSQWDVEITTVSGLTGRTSVLSVADLDRWRLVHARDFFSDVLTMAALYDGIVLPTRRADVTRLASAGR